MQPEQPSAQSPSPSQPTPPQVPPLPAPVSPSRSGPPIWAILFGCCGLFVFVPILAAILFPVFAQARAKARATACMSNQKQIALGILMYSEDYDETLPTTAAWMDKADIYTKNKAVFHCPAVPDKTKYGYAYDSKLSGKSLARFESPRTTRMLYDSTNLDRDASDPGTSIDWQRHGEGAIFGYLDGHVKFEREGAASSGGE